MESKEWIEVSAPTVEEATILGLTRLGITREEAFIEVLDEGSSGFLGFGAREAKVRVTRRPLPAGRARVSTATPPPVPVRREPPVTEVAPAPVEEEAVAPPVREEKQEPAPEPAISEPEPALEAPAPPEQPRPQPEERPEPRKRVEGLDRQEIEAVVKDIAEHLFGEMQVRVKLSWRDEQRPTLWVSLRGKDGSALVGQRGRTLDSIQYLVRALVRNRVSGDFNLVVDADGYRRRRYRSLRRLAHRMAERAVETGQSVRLRPMPARERRIIHVTLREDQRVRTQSSGSGRSRAVTVYPR
ncbi:MAG: RNA-binding cell elongation regulator Jag/EloR [Anaerolineales bacterium]